VNTIAVCIPTYNQACYLRKTVASALAQSSCNVEVWVSDDNSPDDTPEVMGAYANDPRVHYYRQPVNLGIAGNSGWVLAQPKTEFVARLDSDDLLEPDFCAKLSAALRAHSAAGTAHACVREIDQSGNERRLRLLRRPSGFQTGEQALREGRLGYRVAANLCLFRRSALSEIEPYRIAVSYCEDWDLFLRLAAVGWGNVHVADVLARYRVWSDLQGTRARRKHLELVGINGIFQDTLVPAWRSRGWPDSELDEARSSLAQSHARCLVARHWSKDECSQIEADLRSLSPTDARLERKIRFYRSRLGRLSTAFESLKLKTKDSIKKLLLCLR
jgi:glycosyltransferase involved in cell wall biosynthesis